MKIANSTTKTAVSHHHTRKYVIMTMNYVIILNFYLNIHLNSIDNK